MRAKSPFALAALLLSFIACAQETTQPSTYGQGPPALDSLLLWRDSLGSSQSRAVFDATSVYYLDAPNVYAVDKVTGALRWHQTLTYPAGTNLFGGYGTVLAAGTLVIGDIDLFGLDPATGTVRWRFAPRLTYPAERSFTFRTIATDGATVFLGGVWGNVYAVDAATGTPRWISHVTTLPDSFVRVFPPVLAKGVVYAPFADAGPTNAGPNVGGVAAFDASSGRLLWSRTLSSHVAGLTSETHAVAVTPTRVVTGAEDGYLYGLDPGSGAILDTLPRTLFGYPAASDAGGFFALDATDSVLVAGNDDGWLVALDSRDLHRTLWTYMSQPSVTDVVVDASRVYAARGGSIVSAYDIATGRLVWMVPSPQLHDAGEFLGWAPVPDGSRVYLGGDFELYGFRRY